MPERFKVLLVTYGPLYLPLPHSRFIMIRRISRRTTLYLCSPTTQAAESWPCASQSPLRDSTPPRVAFQRRPVQTHVVNRGHFEGFVRGTVIDGDYLSIVRSVRIAARRVFGQILCWLAGSETELARSLRLSPASFSWRNLAAK